MPPRIDLRACTLSHSASQNNLCSALGRLRIDGRASSTPFRPFNTTRSSSTSTVAQRRRKHQDPYVIAQAKARKAANLSRQETLRAARAKNLGDPVRGVTTPFVESFDTARPADSPPEKGKDQYVNHLATPEILQSSLEQSRRLTTPAYVNPNDVNPDRKELDAQSHEGNHANASEALRRILNIDNGSSEDKTRVNVQRCIDTFGRHVTDTHLKPRPTTPWQKRKARETASTVGVLPGKDGQFRPPGESSHTTQEPLMERVGPDTGSSEVQIAILTAKIRSLANFLQHRGRKDKVNKRNMRLLVHRRQKLLRYLRRKERGGDRFRHVTETLGLTEGTYKGEISL